MEVSGGEVSSDGEERQRESWLERADQLKSGAELRRAQKMAGAGRELSDHDTSTTIELNDYGLMLPHSSEQSGMSSCIALKPILASTLITPITSGYSTSSSSLTSMVTSK